MSYPKILKSLEDNKLKLDHFTEDVSGELLYKGAKIAADVAKQDLLTVKRELASLQAVQDVSKRIDGGIAIADIFDGSATGLTLDNSKTTATQALTAGATVLTGKIEDKDAGFKVGQEVTVQDKDNKERVLVNVASYDTSTGTYTLETSALANSYAKGAWIYRSAAYLSKNNDMQLRLDNSTPSDIKTDWSTRGSASSKTWNTMDITTTNNAAHTAGAQYKDYGAHDAGKISFTHHMNKFNYQMHAVVRMRGTSVTAGQYYNEDTFTGWEVYLDGNADLIFRTVGYATNVPITVIKRMVAGTEHSITVEWNKTIRKVFVDIDGTKKEFDLPDFSNENVIEFGYAQYDGTITRKVSEFSIVEDGKIKNYLGKHEDGTSTTNWTLVTSESTGTFATDGASLYADAFGTGSGWHGAFFETPVNNYKDLKLDVDLTLLNSTSNDHMGLIRVQLLDSTDTIQAFFNLQDAWAGSINTALHAESNGNVMFDENLTTTHNDFSGVMSLERKGDSWTFYRNGTKLGSTVTGSNLDITKIRIGIQAYSTNSIATMKINDVKIETTLKNDVTTLDVRYTLPDPTNEVVTWVTHGGIEGLTLSQAVAFGDESNYLAATKTASATEDQFVTTSSTSGTPTIRLTMDRVGKKIAENLTYETTYNSDVPIMTSNTAPSGTASVSSVYDSTIHPYYAFSNTAWVAGTNTGWAAYEFPAGEDTAVRRYGFTTQYGVRAPKDWTFEGWDGSQWVVLDTKTGIGFADGETKYFDISNRTKYIKYRINVTANGGNNWLSMHKIQMFENYNNIFKSNEPFEYSYGFKVFVNSIQTSTGFTVDNATGEILFDNSMLSTDTVSVEYYSYNNEKITKILGAIAK